MLRLLTFLVYDTYNNFYGDHVATSEYMLKRNFIYHEKVCT
jgi:hypothetical protein